MRRLKVGSLISLTLPKLLQQIVFFIGAIYITRNLPLDERGKFAILVLIADVLLVVSLNSPLRYMALYKADKSAQQAVGHYLRILASMLFIIIIGTLAHRLAYVLFAIILFKSLNVLFFTHTLIYTGKMAYARDVVISSLIYLSFLLVWERYTPSIYTLATLQLLVAIPFVIIVLKRYLRIHYFHVDWQSMPKRIENAITPILSLLLRRIEIIYVGVFFTPSMAAKLAVALSVPMILNQLFLPLNASIIERFRLRSKGISKGLVKGLLLVPFGLLILIFVFLRTSEGLMDNLVSYVYGDDYGELGHIFILGCGLSLVWLCSNFLGLFALSTVDSRAEYIPMLIAVIILIASFVLLRPESLMGIMSIKCFAYLGRYYCQLFKINNAL